MKPLTVVTPYNPKPFFEKTLLPFMKSALVERVVVVSQEPVRLKMDKCRVVVARPLPSQETLTLILNQIRTKYLLLLSEAQQISIELKGLERVLEIVESAKAYLEDAKYYRKKGKLEVSLTSIAYCEGLLDALKLLGAIKANSKK